MPGSDFLAVILSPATQPQQGRPRSSSAVATCIVWRAATACEASRGRAGGSTCEAGLERVGENDLGDRRVPGGGD